MAEAFNIGRFTGISFSDDTVQETAAQAIHVTVDDTPTHAGQLLISQPGNETAIWADPQVQGLYAEGSSISDPPAYSAPTTICPIYIGGKNPTGDLLGISVDADGYLEVSNAVLNDLTFTQYGSPAVEALNVYVVNEAGSSGNPAAGLTGSPVPTYADYIGFEDDSSNLIGVSATNPLPVVGSFAAPTGTQTVTVAGTSTVTIAGIAAGTVQVAGIVGTSTVTVAGNVAVTGQLTAPTGTQTVEVAGIVGTSTVTVAGNVAVASVAGTSTVEIAGIVGTPTVEVAGVLGTSTVTVAGNVSVSSVAGTSTVTVAGNVSVTGQLTAPTGTQTVQVAGISAGTIAVAGTSTVTVIGGAGNAAAGATGSPVPSDADYIGFLNGATLVGVSVTNPLPITGSLAAPTNTQTVTIAGNVTVTGQLTAPTGTQTVEVAGIVGTSTVEVAGIVGTSTVTVAGNIAVASVAGTSTVEVAGIVGTSTVAVTGQIAGPVAAGIAASSSVLTGQVYNSTAPALTTGQQVAEQCDAAGSIFVHPFRRSQLVMSTATVTGTTAVTLVANPGASTYADILSLMGGFQITSTATLVAQAIVGTLIISDGTISYSVPITSAYSPFNICLEAPIPATNASTTWSVALKAVLIGSPTVNLSCMVVKQVAS